MEKKSRNLMITGTERHILNLVKLTRHALEYPKDGMEANAIQLKSNFGTISSNRIRQILHKIKPIPSCAKRLRTLKGMEVKVGIPEFLNGIGNGVESHVAKLEAEIGDFQKLLVTRTLKLKKLGVPCKHRKLILKYTHKYRLGLWRPLAQAIKSYLSSPNLSFIIKFNGSSSDWLEFSSTRLRRDYDFGYDVLINSIKTPLDNNMPSITAINSKGNDKELYNPV
ncbi:hypothetical protein Prudu_005537 [Prunus dulcis]|uniref:Small ribosomal subunit protein mS41 SAM domain-containing protein n=1 Tax=Prunus dulcis TaxID=3755 RepID=A0A4Y1QXT5_PRUDU|nr:hypothetical protein Prudu_005537 [Prunus dulcis]